MLVLGLSGSLRRASHNRRLLGAAARELEPAVDFEEWMRLGAIPPYNEDLDVASAPQPVHELRAALGRADAVLIATPEYNHSIPGQLKNAFDWVSRPVVTNPMRNKPVAVIGTSTGAFGGVWAQAELRKVLGALGARVLDVELAVPHAHERFDQLGRLTDGNFVEQLTSVVDSLVLAAAERAARIEVSA